MRPLSESAHRKLGRLLAPRAHDDGSLLHGRYRIHRELARGGAGVVHAGDDLELDRPVAVKVLSESARASDVMRRRFHREARALAGVSHRNVVTIFDWGEADGEMYLVMELVDGRSLRHVLDEDTYDPRELVHLITAAAEGVAAAHAAGIVHRDLKPGNILVDGCGDPKVIDFGLAWRRDDTVLTRTGAAVGTPFYMAPEQVEGRGRAITASTDVYALGAILYEALCGRPPHVGEHAVEVCTRITTEDPRAPRRIDARIDRELETVCLKALEKEPSRRYPSAAELAGDLGRWLAGRPVLARPPSWPRRWRRRLARRRAAVAVASLGVLALIVTLSILVPRLRTEAERAARAERALELWGRISTLDSDARLYAYRGLLDESHRRLDEAIAICRASLAGGEDAYARFFLGRLLRRLGDPDAALRELDRAIAEDPDLREARCERGLLLVDRYGDRLRTCRITPGTAWWAPQAAPMAAPGRLEELHPDLADLRARAMADLTVEPPGSPYVRDADAAYGRAELARLRGDAREAERGLRAVIEAEPLHVRAHLSLARLAEGRGDVEGALARVSRALELHPGSTTAWLHRSNLHLQRAQRTAWSSESIGHCTAAARDAASAIAVGGAGPAAHTHRAHALLQRAMLPVRLPGEECPDLEEAAEEYRRAAGCDPRYVPAWVNLGSALRLLGDAFRRDRAYDDALDAWDEAVEAHGRTLALQPSAETYFNRANAYHQRASLVAELARRRDAELGDPEDAARSFELAVRDHTAALEIQPRFVRALANRGNVRAAHALLCRRTGDEDGCDRLAGLALADYERALALEPKLAVVYVNRAHLYDWRGQASRAFADYDRAVQVDPVADSYYYRGTARLAAAHRLEREGRGAEADELGRLGLADYAEAKRRARRPWSFASRVDRILRRHAGEAD